MLTVTLESNDLAIDGSVILMVKDVLFETGFNDVVPCKVFIDVDKLERAFLLLQLLKLMLCFD